MFIFHYHFSHEDMTCNFHFEKHYCMFSFHKIMLVDEFKKKKNFMIYKNNTSIYKQNNLPKYCKNLQKEIFTFFSSHFIILKKILKFTKKWKRRRKIHEKIQKENCILKKKKWKMKKKINTWFYFILKTRKTKTSQSYEVNKILVTQKVEKEKTNLSHLLLFEVK